MHYAMILRCKFPDGKIDHYVWMTDQGTQKQAEKHITQGFEKVNVYGEDAKGRPLAVLEELIYFGETASNVYEDTCDLFEKAAKKASGLKNKAKSAAKGAGEAKAEKAVKEAV